MKKIFAIGGGEIGTGTLCQDSANPYIDSEMIRLLGKKDPNIAFIPGCGRSDLKGYCDKFERFFEDNFSIKPKSLESIYNEMTLSEFERMTNDIDLLYIGGGDTVTMLKIFRDKGIDKKLKEMYERGVMLAGVSAGAICWFNYGVTDSNPKRKPFGEMEALGFVKGICCPHYDSEPARKEILEILVDEYKESGYGIPDGSALYIENDIIHLIEGEKEISVHSVSSV